MSCWSRVWQGERRSVSDFYVLCRFLHQTLLRADCPDPFAYSAKKAISVASPTRRCTILALRTGLANMTAVEAGDATELLWD